MDHRCGPRPLPDGRRGRHLHLSPPPIYARSIEDGELLRKAQAGDRQALDRLLRLHRDRLYAVCRRLTGNEADALDACQEALIAIVRGLAGFDGRSSFTTWAHRVAANAALDEIRRRGRRPVPGLDPSASMPGAGPPFDDSVATRVDVDSALETLDPDFRTPVVLRDVAGLSYAEIAEALDIPAGTVRSRIARGRAALAECLGAGGEPADPGLRRIERP